MTKVAWVTGRKKALARSVAIAIAEREGFDWLLLNELRQRQRFEEAMRMVDSWIQLGVLATFLYDYREKEPEPPDPVTGK